MNQFSNWINLLILEAQGLEREARKDNAAPSIERPQRAPAKTPATQPRRPTCAECGRFIEGKLASLKKLWKKMKKLGDRSFGRDSGRFRSVPIGSDRFRSVWLRFGGWSGTGGETGEGGGSAIARNPTGVGKKAFRNSRNREVSPCFAERHAGFSRATPSNSRRPLQSSMVATHHGRCQTPFARNTTQ